MRLSLNDLLQLMSSLPLYELIVGRDLTIQWQYILHHKFFYLTHAMGQSYPEVITF